MFCFATESRGNKLSKTKHFQSNVVFLFLAIGSLEAQNFRSS